MARHNRPALLSALTQYREVLEGLETLVRAQDWPALHQQLAEAQALRPPFLEPPPPPP
jgi:prephenate dehydrogenase